MVSEGMNPTFPLTSPSNKDPSNKRRAVMCPYGPRELCPQTDCSCVHVFVGGNDTDYAFSNGANQNLERAECGICLEIPNLFGLLVNCDHLFCLSCMRRWRGSTPGFHHSTPQNSCPTCRRYSPLILPSYKSFQNDGAGKREAIRLYSESLKLLEPEERFNLQVGFPQDIVEDDPSDQSSTMLDSFENAVTNHSVLRMISDGEISAQLRQLLTQRQDNQLESELYMDRGSLITSDDSFLENSHAEPYSSESESSNMQLNSSLRANSDADFSEPSPQFRTDYFEPYRFESFLRNSYSQSIASHLSYFATAFEENYPPSHQEFLAAPLSESDRDDQTTSSTASLVNESEASVTGSFYQTQSECAGDAGDPSSNSSGRENQDPHTDPFTPQHSFRNTSDLSGQEIVIHDANLWDPSDPESDWRSSNSLNLVDHRSGRASPSVEADEQFASSFEQSTTIPAEDRSLRNDYSWNLSSPEPNGYLTHLLDITNPWAEYASSFGSDDRYNSSSAGFLANSGSSQLFDSQSEYTTDSHRSSPASDGQRIPSGFSSEISDYSDYSDDGDLSQSSLV